MPTYKTPGVYVEELSLFPPSVAAVETAIPVFIGYTAKAIDSDGTTDLTNKPKRITSLLEYEKYFGKAQTESISYDVVQEKSSAMGEITSTTITPASGSGPQDRPYYTYYSMQLFFANGGGPCYVLSVGAYQTSAAATSTDFDDAIDILESWDEPTLLVFPDACLLSDANHGNVVEKALMHCSKMQDRFTIADVRNAVSGGAADAATFRREVAADLTQLKYGAAYFPYLDTSLPYRTDDDNVQVATHKVRVAGVESAGAIGDGTPINDATVKDSENALYNAIKAKVAELLVTVPPSGAVAGVYARVDRDRGVFKAPANVALANVIRPAISITNDLNDELNIHTVAGKSVNAIREFTGKGTLIWGARTLAGNDNENRYVPVRRFLIMAEESIKKASGTFVFEPNDANTWTKVRAMIENFLIIQWRDGALQGAKPEHAFYVSVGLNKTMTAQDILDGYMIVEIGLAIVRPAEFIVLRFAQKMAES